MSTKSKFRNGVLSFYDSVTKETLLPLAPVVFYDDFLGGDLVIPAAGSAESGCRWVKKIVGAAPPTVAKVANSANGIAACTLTATSEKQDAALYFNDQKNFAVTQGCVFEAVIKMSVLPTGTAQMVWGLVSNWTDGPDNITFSAFFKANGSGLINCEMDDNVTDSSVSSGVTLANTDTAICRIDFNDVTNVKYYINGTQVATGTTFGFAATGTNAVLQPFFQAYKPSGTDVGTLQVDSVRIWQNRS